MDDLHRDKEEQYTSFSTSVGCRQNSEQQRRPVWMQKALDTLWEDVSPTLMVLDRDYGVHRDGRGNEQSRS